MPPEATTTAQGSGALDATAIGKLINDAIGAALKPITDGLGELAKNQKVLADTFAADQQKAAEAAKAAAAATTTDAKKGEPPKPLTLEDVTKVVNDSVANQLKTREEAAASTEARNKFIGEKLKDLTPAYQNLLGNDPAKWAAEEQQIRDKFKAEITAAGLKIPDVGGGNAGGATGSGGAGGAAPPTSNPYLDKGLTPAQAGYANSLKLPTAAAK
jgi:hypothetical protein